MRSWSFEGVGLRQAGQIRVVGDGEVVPLPGRYALTGSVDAQCHRTVEGAPSGPVLMTRRPRSGGLAISAAPASRRCGTPAATGPSLPIDRVCDRETVRAVGQAAHQQWAQRGGARNSDPVCWCGSGVGRSRPGVAAAGRRVKVSPSSQPSPTCATRVSTSRSTGYGTPTGSASCLQDDVGHHEVVV